MIVKLEVLEYRYYNFNIQDYFDYIKNNNYDLTDDDIDDDDGFCYWVLEEMCGECGTDDIYTESQGISLYKLEKQEERLLKLLKLKTL